MKYKNAQWALAAAIVSGCAAPPPAKLDAGGERQLVASDAVRIAILPTDAQRIDDFHVPFRSDTWKVITGPVWSQAFIGNVNADPVFTIKSAELRQTIAAAGFTTRFTYTVHGEVASGEKRLAIDAEGTRAAAMAIGSAMRQAVELGVKDAAEKAAKALLNEGSASHGTN